MRHFPIFLDLKDRRVLVTGAGECAIAKLRLLLKTEAQITVFASDIDPLVEEWQVQGLLQIEHRTIEAGDFDNVAMVYIAQENKRIDAQTAKLAKQAGVLFNVVDQLEKSQFITPAIVDRDPVTVAIGTEGTAPVLARKIKSEIEAQLPSGLGMLARIANHFRAKAATLPMGRARRAFWSAFFYDKGPTALKQGGELGVEHCLEELHEVHSSDETPAELGKVYFVGSGPGDPDLLTRKAAKLLHDADVILHDKEVSQQVLELARREAIIKQAGTQSKTYLVDEARAGTNIVRLKAGDATILGRLEEELEAVERAGLDYEIVPGITSASAIAASMIVPQTKYRMTTHSALDQLKLSKKSSENTKLKAQ